MHGISRFVFATDVDKNLIIETDGALSVGQIINNRFGAVEYEQMIPGYKICIRYAGTLRGTIDTDETVNASLIEMANFLLEEKIMKNEKYYARYKNK